MRVTSGFLLVLGLSLVSLVPIDAQPGCDNMSFPYAYGCPTTTLHCSPDPTHDHTELGPVLKWANGTTIYYCQSNISDNCLVDGSINQCIDDAFKMWTSLCPEGTITAEQDLTGAHCCITIKWSADPAEFWPDAANTSGLTHQINRCPDNSMQCQVGSNPLNHTRIVLNRTQDYGGVLAYPCPPPSNCDYDHNKNLRNLCSVLAHEIGHVFGLQHTEEPGPFYCDPRSSSPSDLMFWAHDGCSPPVLTLHDKCMFAKLYCNGQLGVVPSVFPASAMIHDLKIFPNPTQQNITLSVANPRSLPIKVSIFDLLGIEIYHTTILDRETAVVTTLDISKLPSGRYYLRVENSSIRATKPFVKTFK